MGKPKRNTNFVAIGFFFLNKGCAVESRCSFLHLIERVVLLHIRLSAKCTAVADSRAFQRFTTTMILLAAVEIGVQTEITNLTHAQLRALEAIDATIAAIFALEVCKNRTHVFPFSCCRYDLYVHLV